MIQQCRAEWKMTNQYSTTKRSHNELEMKEFGILQKLYKAGSFWNFLTNIAILLSYYTNHCTCRARHAATTPNLYNEINLWLFLVWL